MSLTTLTVLAVAAAVPALPTADRSQMAAEIMQSYFESGDFTGAAVLADGEEVIFAGGVGLANREWSMPNDADTKYRIASITKQFTSMLIFQLVAEGKLDLNGTVSDYLPSYRTDTGAQLTIGLLLQHRSGLADMPLTTANIADAATVVDTNVPRFIAEYCSGDLQFEPGTNFNYCNAEYNVLGAIIEQVTGKSYETVLRERILDPLDMNDTGMVRNEVVLPRQAGGYERKDDGTFTRSPLDHWQVAYAAAGMYSTPNDLLRWTRAVMDFRLLDESWTRTMYTPRDDIGVEGNYVAYGSWVYPRALPPENEQRPILVERRGFISPFTMLVVMAPQRKVSLILMSNTTTANIHELPYANGLPLDLLLIAFDKEPIGK